MQFAIYLELAYFSRCSQPKLAACFRRMAPRLELPAAAGVAVPLIFGICLSVRHVPLTSLPAPLSLCPPRPFPPLPAAQTYVAPAPPTPLAPRGPRSRSTVLLPPCPPPIDLARGAQSCSQRLTAARSSPRPLPLVFLFPSLSILLSRVHSLFARWIDPDASPL